MLWQAVCDIPWYSEDNRSYVLCGPDSQVLEFSGSAHTAWLLLQEPITIEELLRNLGGRDAADGESALLGFLRQCQVAGCVQLIDKYGAV